MTPSGRLAIYEVVCPFPPCEAHPGEPCWDESTRSFLTASQSHDQRKRRAQAVVAGPLGCPYFAEENGEVIWCDLDPVTPHHGQKVIDGETVRAPTPCPDCARPTWDGLHRDGHRECVMAEVETTP